MISAKVVADSTCNGHRITTMLVTMPRIILAEFNTHRMFSRNSASSRAIPFKKMVETVENNPFIPIAWQRDHSGMQGVEYITDEVQLELNRKAWLGAMRNAVGSAGYLNHARHAGGDVTKQLCNRLLEPFMWHTVLVTATEWENFFYLRCSQYNVKKELFRSKKDVLKKYDSFGFALDDTLNWLRINGGQAEIHMMALAEAMWDARNESVPTELSAGQWHIPFKESIIGESNEEWNRIYDELHPGTNDWELAEPIAIKIATAKAAQTSYTVVGEDGKETPYDKLIALHDRLLASGHMSPFEHCAQAMTTVEETIYVKQASPPNVNGYYVGPEYGWCHNYRGWKSYRSMIPNENKT